MNASWVRQVRTAAFVLLAATGIAALAAGTAIARSSGWLFALRGGAAGRRPSTEIIIDARPA